MNNPISNMADKTESLVDSGTQTAEQVIRSTQRSAGETLNQLANTVESVRAQAGPAINRIANDADQMRQRSADALREASFQLRESALRATDKSVAFIRDEPVKSVLIAAAIGAASMALMSAFSRRE